MEWFWLLKCNETIKMDKVQMEVIIPIPLEWAGHVRVIMYSFETHLRKERSNYLIIISWVFNTARVRQQIRRFNVFLLLLA